MKRIIDVMCRCHLFDGIPEDKYKNVLNCLNAQLKTYAKDAVILHIGEQQGRPGVVVSGTLRLALYSEDGNLLTIDRLSVGQIFGETLACAKKQESPVQIDALSDAEVLYLSFDPLLLEQGASCPHKMQVTANLLREMGQGDLVRREVEARQRLQKAFGGLGDIQGRGGHGDERHGEHHEQHARGHEQALAHARLVIIKIGSAVLTDPSGLCAAVLGCLKKVWHNI